jgi:hypothetical protein
LDYVFGETIQEPSQLILGHFDAQEGKGMSQEGKGMSCQGEGMSCQVYLVVTFMFQIQGI